MACKFKGCPNLPLDAILKGAELIGANLSGCDLTHCDLKDADLARASFKEKTMERRLFKKKGNLNYFPSLFMNILCGYGEKPYRIVLSALLTIFLFALIYFSLNAVESSTVSNYILRWTDSLSRGNILQDKEIYHAFVT